MLRLEYRMHKDDILSLYIMGFTSAHIPALTKVFRFSTCDIEKPEKGLRVS